MMLKKWGQIAQLYFIRAAEMEDNRKPIEVS